MPSVAYVLIVEGNPVGMFDTLELAQTDARAHISASKSVRIESLAAPAPSEAWIYAPEVSGWVHQRNAAAG